MSWFISPLTGVLTHTYELVNELLPSAKWLITNTLQAFPRPPISECPDVENPPSWRCPLCVFGSLPLDEDSFMVHPTTNGTKTSKIAQKNWRENFWKKAPHWHTYIYTCFLSIRETLFGTLRHHFLFATKKKNAKRIDGAPPMHLGLKAPLRNLIAPAFCQGFCGEKLVDLVPGCFPEG